MWTWSVDDVAHWLSSFEALKAYAAELKRKEVDGRMLLELATSANPGALETMAGISFNAHRRLFRNELNVLLEKCAAAAPAHSYRYRPTQPTHTTVPHMFAQKVE